MQRLTAKRCQETSSTATKKAKVARTSFFGKSTRVVAVLSLVAMTEVVAVSVRPFIPPPLDQRNAERIEVQTLPVLSQLRPTTMQVADDGTHSRVLDLLLLDGAEDYRRPCRKKNNGQVKHFLNRHLLADGFKLGVDSSHERRKWVRVEKSALRLAYPRNQIWGAVFIVNREIAPPKKRTGIDLSHFHFLCVDLKGKKGGEVVEIGIKDETQPDDGTEPTVAVRLTRSWKTYTFDLRQFSPTKLRKLYVVAEIKFSGDEPFTVFVRDVAFRANAQR